MIISMVIMKRISPGWEARFAIGLVSNDHKSRLLLLMHRETAIIPTWDGWRERERDRGRYGKREGRKEGGRREGEGGREGGGRAGTGKERVRGKEVQALNEMTCTI